MSGVDDRVKEFLNGWPIARKQLEEIVGDEQGDELDRPSQEAEGS